MIQNASIRLRPNKPVLLSLKKLNVCLNSLRPCHFRKYGELVDSDLELAYNYRLPPLGLEYLSSLFKLSLNCILVAMSTLKVFTIPVLYTAMAVITSVAAIENGTSAASVDYGAIFPVVIPTSSNAPYYNIAQFCAYPAP